MSRKLHIFRVASDSPATLLQDISLELEHPQCSSAVVQVGNELQKLIGLDQLSMSAEEVASHLEDSAMCELCPNVLSVFLSCLVLQYHTVIHL